MKNKKLTFNKLKINGCTLFLNESQSRFLSERLIVGKNLTYFNIDQIKMALFDLRENSHIRLYSLHDINSLAANLFEEIGRNYATHLSGDSGNIRKDKILSKNHNIDFDIGVDVYSQSTNINDDSDFSYFEDTKFDDETEASIAIDRFFVKNINKL